MSAGTDRLIHNEVLRPGEWIVSENKCFFAIMQCDGNFVVYKGSGPCDNHGILWAHNKTGTEGFLVFQADGNLVVYGGCPGAAGTVIWASGTHKKSGDRLVMQNDGNLVIYAGSKALWSSNTCIPNLQFPLKTIDVFHYAHVHLTQKQTGNLLDNDLSGKLYTSPANRSRFQTWYLHRDLDGSFSLKSAVNERLLDSNRDGVAYLRDENGGNNQKWAVEQVADGYCRLINIATGKALDANESKNVYTHGVNNGGYQLWKIEAATLRDALDKSKVVSKTLTLANGSPRQLYYYRDNDSTLILNNINASIDNAVKPAANGKYKGCGIYAAQNALGCFGFVLPQDEIAEVIPTQQFPIKSISSNIWTYPADLANGVRKLLGQRVGGVKVAKVSHKHKENAFVKEKLKSGFPVIALVDNGSHYVVVIGYIDGGGYIVHDNTNKKIRGKIDTSFHANSSSGFFGKMVDAVTPSSWEEGTYIYFEDNKFTFAETSSNGPALATSGLRILLAWTGTGNSKLNFAASENGLSFSGTTTIDDTSPAAPSLAFFKGQWFVTWIGKGNNRLNVMRSTDGRSWVGKVTLQETSPSTPALAMLGDYLYLCWRGTNNDRLNVLRSVDGTTWRDKVTLADSTTSGPAIVGFDKRLLLAWRGCGNNRLNVMSSGPSMDFSGKVTLPETTQSRPSLAVRQAKAYLGWEGINNRRLNLASSSDCKLWTEKFTSYETCIDGPTLSQVNETLVWAWTGTGGNRLNTMIVDGLL